MVSLWPWRDKTSAESFEKTLSAISTKISKASVHNDRLRQRARKLKVGWTLYGGFTYILAVLIFTLVTGWRNWGAMEYTVVSGGPVVLYVVRYLLTSWYNYRVANATDALDALYKERDSTIEKLKQATKYNSTQQLLEKYGAGKQITEKKKEEQKDKTPKSPNRRASGGRVLMEPPPTANIPRRHSSMNPAEMQGQPQPSTPSQGQGPALSHPGSPSPMQPRPPPIQETAEFAPNAYDSPMQYAPAVSPQEPRWYDRLVNALLGEDETRSDRRLALICTKCRLVNGLAPPGARTLEEVGKWKCSSCGSWNGEELLPVKQATSDHSRGASVPKVDELVIQKARSGSIDDETSDGFESAGG